MDDDSTGFEFAHGTTRPSRHFLPSGVPQCEHMNGMEVIQPFIAAGDVHDLELPCGRVVCEAVCIVPVLPSMPFDEIGGARQCNPIDYSGTVMHPTIPKQKKSGLLE
jgi:hypothetical protein